MIEASPAEADAGAFGYGRKNLRIIIWLTVLCGGER
jgi:hypothetical protein